MLISEIFEQYIKKYPIYQSIKFSTGGSSIEEGLHPIFIITQYITDKLIECGNNRIAIVLPDDECNIIPMLIAKYFTNVQFSEGYAGSVLDEVEPGQHVRLGKAVVEFLGIIDGDGSSTSGKCIKFKVNRSSPITVTCPINGTHYLLEKTNGAISSYKLWCDSVKAATANFEEKNAIFSLKFKRTALKKTICVLSQKNDFMNFTNQLKINGMEFDDILTYGEINTDNPNMFSVLNKGRLDCLPSISFAHEMDDICEMLKNDEYKNKVYAIYSTIEKFKEVVENTDALKKVLKTQVPFIMFIPESEFEYGDMLETYKFKIWHWKPSTINSEVFLLPSHDESLSIPLPIFGKIEQRVNNAAHAEFILKISESTQLKQIAAQMRVLSQQTTDADIKLKKLVRKIWDIYRKFMWLICENTGLIKDTIETESAEAKALWDEQKDYYLNLPIEKTVNRIFSLFNKFAAETKSPKLIALERFLQSISDQEKSVCILVPDKYPYCRKTYSCLESAKGHCNMSVKTETQFFADFEDCFKEYDYLIVTWFDKDEYIRIKQTYCYENLVFVLYDFENKWRENYLKEFDAKIPHEKIKMSASELGFDECEISDRPFDQVYTGGDKEFEEISDYNFQNNIVRSIIRNSGAGISETDAIESISLLLSDDKIAYFYPSHEVVDVTALVKGDINRPVKKKAISLKKGDKILIRQSGRDIIKEKADDLMLKNGEGKLRQSSELWMRVLNLLACEMSATQIFEQLNLNHAGCSIQQVRYWLSGDVIIPRDKKVLVAIADVAEQIDVLRELRKPYRASIDAIIVAGKKVQGYHQSAGVWLSKELRSKASEIKDIINKNSGHGRIDGIGDVVIYTVEDVLGKEIVARGHINRIEDLY